MTELPRLSDAQRGHLGALLSLTDGYNPDCPLCVEIAQALDLCWSCGSGVHYSEACTIGEARRRERTGVQHG